MKFDPLRKRWKVYERLSNKTDSYVFTWQGPHGEYRALTSAEPLLVKLRECDLSRYRAAGDQFEELTRDLDERRQNWVKSRYYKWMEAKREYLSDLRQRFLGVRETIVPGRPRGRIYIPSAENRKWLRQMQDSRGPVL